MKKLKSPSIVVIFIVSFLILLTAKIPNVLGMMSREMSIEEMTNYSDCIAIGTVISKESSWIENNSWIVTHAVVDVNEVLVGNPDLHSFLVEYDGGEVGEVGLKVSDVSPLNCGEKVLLFLYDIDANQKNIKRDSQAKKFRIVENAQGNFLIKNGIARRKGFSVIKGEIKEREIRIEQLKRRIRDAKKYEQHEI